MSIEQLEQFTLLNDAQPIGQAIGGHVPNLADYFGVWAMDPDTFAGLVQHANRLDLAAHVQNIDNRARVQQSNSRRDFELTDDGVAMFHIHGPTAKQVGSLSAGTSTVRIRQQLRNAKRDPAVRGGLLILDTPGGTAKGNSDLADDVAAFAKEKPLHAFVEDMAASAGVSVASQAARITANCDQCLYGSLGTFAVAVDSSAAADRLGLAVHVIRAGEYKGAGTPGTEITAEQLEDMQRIVNSINEHYLGLVARGRSMTVDQVRELADGRIHPANEAQRLGLVDQVAPMEAAYSDLLAAIESGHKPTRGPTKQQAAPADPGDDDAENDDDPQADDDAGETPDEGATENMAAATLQELREAFPESTAEWREQQQIAGNDLQAAALDYANQAAKANAELRQQLEQQQQQNTARQTASALGQQPFTDDNASQAGTDEGYNGDPVQDFNQAVEQAAGPNPTRERRMGAVQAVAKRKPDLYQAYLLETNRGSRKATRQLLEKFDD